MSHCTLTDLEIDTLLAGKGLLIPAAILPRVREACRGLKGLAISLQRQLPE